MRGSLNHVTTRIHGQEALHRNPRLPDERVRQLAHGRSAGRTSGPGSHRPRGRCRRDSAQHLLDPRTRARPRVFATRPLARTEAGQPGHGHRRRRLCGQSGRRGDPRSRAVRRCGVRPADPAPSAGNDRRRAQQQAAAGRRVVPGNRKIRPPARAAHRRSERLCVSDGRLQQVLHVLRGAVHPWRRGQPTVRRRDRGNHSPGRTRRA